MLPELRDDSLSPSLPSPPPPLQPPPSSSPSGSAKPAKRNRKHLDTPTAQGIERVARIERQRRSGVVRLTTITRLRAPLAGGGLPVSPKYALASPAAGGCGGVALRNAAVVVVVRGGLRERALLGGHYASRWAPTGSSGQTVAAALSQRGAEVEQGDAAVVSWRWRRA
jgi:hypothetical protein